MRWSMHNRIRKKHVHKYVRAITSYYLALIRKGSHLTLNSVTWMLNLQTNKGKIKEYSALSLSHLQGRHLESPQWDWVSLNDDVNTKALGGYSFISPLFVDLISILIFMVLVNWYYYRLHEMMIADIDSFFIHVPLGVLIPRQFQCCANGAAQ